MDLATAYSNPSPQFKSHTNQIPELLVGPNRNLGPCPVADGAGPRSPSGLPWAINRCLTEAARGAIVSERHAGALQKILADKYGISISSAKRIVRNGRR